VSRRLRSHLLVAGGYAVIAFGYFGARFVAHPGRPLVGHGKDPQIFVWSFAWWLHALESWQNPFYSHAIYAPDGVNLVWVTSVPGLALLFTPLTELAGPAVSFNAAEMLLPAASAFTAYLLCRHLTRSLWPSLVGGYLFGFSSYMLGQMQGHMHMAAVFLLPLMALAVVRYVQLNLDGRGLAWRLGLLFGLQFWLSTEVLVTAALALAVSILLAYPLVPSARAPIRAIWLPLLAAAGVAVVVAAPLVYYALTGFQSNSVNPPAPFDGDLLNFFLPTHLTWAGGAALDSISKHFRGNDAEAGAYLGIPTLVIVAWYALGARRSATVRYLLVALGLAAVVTLGTGVVIKGHIEAWLPWRLIVDLPIFNNIITARISAYVALIAAVIVALWTSGRHGWTRWLLPALAVAALVPDLTRAYWVVHPERWSFFTSQVYEICFPRNENVAIFPFGGWGNSTLWQAESGFYFRIPEGNLAPSPPAKNLSSDPMIRYVTYTGLDPTPRMILGFVKNKKVDRILSVSVYGHPDGHQIRRFGEYQDTGGVLVAPACSYPSLQKGIHPATQHFGS